MHNASPLDILTHTPFWVWAALVALVWLGLRRTADREVTLSRMVLFPIIATLLALYGMAASWSGIGSGLGLLAGLSAGAFLAIAMERRNPARLVANGRLLLAGEWTSLAILVALFLTHYVDAVLGVVSPALVDSQGFRLLTTAIYGGAAANMMVRTALRLAVATRPVALG